MLSRPPVSPRSAGFKNTMIAAAVAGLLVGPSLAGAAATAKNLAALAPAVSGATYVPTGINNLGQVVLDVNYPFGYDQNNPSVANTNAPSQTATYRLTPATNGAAQVTFTAGDGRRDYVFGNGINASGTVGGYLGTSLAGAPFGPPQVFVAPSTTATTLAPSFGGTAYFGTAINDGGTFVGRGAELGTGRLRALVAVPSGAAYSYYDLGVKYSTATTSNTSSATGVNNSGLVVGVTPVSYGSVLVGSGQAFYEPQNSDGTYSTNTATTGTMVVIGTLQTPTQTTDATPVTYTPGNSTAYGVNEAGTIVGDSTYTTSGGTAGTVRHAFSFTTAGGMKDLGVLGTSTGASTAFDVNNNGLIVGTQASFNGTSGLSHAFGFLAGQLFDLNSLIDPASGWVLNTATAVNDSSQVVGQGTLNGLPQAYLITVPEPSSIAAISVASSLIVGRRRRRGVEASR